MNSDGVKAPLLSSFRVEGVGRTVLVNVASVLELVLVAHSLRHRHRVAMAALSLA